MRQLRACRRSRTGSVLQSRTSAPHEDRLDQFNTTVYGYDDRFRGIHGTRMVVLIHRNDMARFGLNVRDVVTLSTAVDDGGQRGVRSDGGAYDIPEGNVVACIPAAKSIPMRVLDQNHRRKHGVYNRRVPGDLHASLRNVAKVCVRTDAHSGKIRPDDYVGSSVTELKNLGRSDTVRPRQFSRVLGRAAVRGEPSNRGPRRSTRDSTAAHAGLWRDHQHHLGDSVPRQSSAA